MQNTPSFWYPKEKQISLKALGLWPLTLLWRAGAALRRMTTTPYAPKTPTIVIGNITAGGTGKTPLVAALVDAAREQGRTPVILTRGYGGVIPGPHLVGDHDNAKTVGDEAYWMARQAPVVVARHRGQGAAWIDQNMTDCDLIIMDDGLQNPSITPHCKVATFSGRLGIGNGMLIPSGPLRERFTALQKCDAVVITGRDETGLEDDICKLSVTLPIFAVERRLNPSHLTALKKKPVIAFAGIGNPGGFFDMLKDNKITLISTHIFPDHHPYTTDDLASLKAEAKANNALLVTTEKDMVRLEGHDHDAITALALESRIDPSFMDILPDRTV